MTMTRPLSTDEEGGGDTGGNAQIRARTAINANWQRQGVRNENDKN